MSLSVPERTRYSRQLLLPGFDLAAQRKLKAARVLVLGAGGLGSPALLYLASAGVGTLGIVDDDVVEISNLQRQIVHTTDAVKMAKVDSAARTVTALNPEITVERHRVRLTSENALDLFARYDLVVDGTDSFQSRYLTGDAAEITGIPHVWGSLLRYEGQVSVFWSGHGPVYRDVFPEPPNPGEVPSCSVGGLFGPLAGAAGAIMAGQALKVITGVGETLLGRLLILDSLHDTQRVLRIGVDPDRQPVTHLADYETLCGDPLSGEGSTPEEATARASITPGRLRDLLGSRDLGAADFDLIDVREPAEYEIVRIPGARLIPLEEFLSGRAAGTLDPTRTTIVYCKTGRRSAQVRDLLQTRGFADVRSLDGGVLAWVRQIQPELAEY